MQIIGNIHVETVQKERERVSLSLPVNKLVNQQDQFGPISVVGQDRKLRKHVTYVFNVSRMQDIMQNIEIFIPRDAKIVFYHIFKEM